MVKTARNNVSLQAFSGTQGISTAAVRFPGYPMRITYSPNLLGRVLNGAGEPHNPFLARIGIQADADIAVFAGACWRRRSRSASRWKGHAGAGVMTDVTAPLFIL